AFPTKRFAGDVRSHAQTGLADLPDAAGQARVGKEAHAERGGGAIENLHQVSRLGFGFVGRACAEFHHQPATAFGQQREAFEVHAFASARVDHDVVKTFEADGTVLHDLRDVVGTEIDIGPSDDDEHARRRTLDQAAG